MPSDILFQISGGGSGSSNDYVKDNFTDTTRPASGNTGFSTSILKNPFTQNFVDNDAPKYGSKILWIKELKLLEDRTKWQSNLPTYEVIFTESYPGVYCYCYGNARLKTFNTGVNIELLNINDTFGCTGLMRRVSFIVNGSDQATGTASIYVDGVDTTNDISFGNMPTSMAANGYNKFLAIPHASANETKDIHDYQIRANEYNTLNVTGLIVYYENATTNVDLFPGSTYVDKVLSTTSGITMIALATADRNGAKTIITKSASAAYGTTTVSSPIAYTTGSGTSGTGTITVATGTGASFPAGTGFVVPQGTSFYLGAVTSVSTDTLTVAPNLPFNLAAGSTMWTLWQAGTTLSIGVSMYRLAKTVEIGSGSVFGNADGFNNTSVGDKYWEDAEQKYRVWGRAFVSSASDGNLGVGWNGASLGFMQVDGYFSAAEIEYAGSGILHATLTINGLNGYGFNAGFTGYQKHTVVTNGGSGWNSFVLTPGTSFANVVITKINLYERAYDPNITLGVLAEYDTLPTKIFRSAINATLSEIGTFRRVYADSLYLSGSWVRGTTYSAAGGVYYSGSSTNSAITLYYYGKNFSVVGTGGASTSLSLDGGAATFIAFNAFNAVTTEGFHKVVITNASGQTAIINAIDYTKTVSGIRNLQNYVPSIGLTSIPAVYNQYMTPKKHIDGSVWMHSKYEGDMWIWFGDRWYKMQSLGQSDDPNAGLIISAGGDI